MEKLRLESLLIEITDITDNCRDCDTCLLNDHSKYDSCIIALREMSLSGNLPSFMKEWRASHYKHTFLKEFRKRFPNMFNKNDQSVINKYCVASLFLGKPCPYSEPDYCKRCWNTEYEEVSRYE